MNEISALDTYKEPESSSIITDIDIEQIYNRHVSTIYKICYMMLHNVADAEDTVQTVFIKLMQAKPKLSSAEHEKAWLIVTAKNHCKNILKQSWKKKRVDMERIEEPMSEDDYWKSELLQEVLMLNDKYLIVIYLYYYEGYSTREIGDMLSLNYPTVRTRLHIGRKKLKMSLED